MYPRGLIPWDSEDQTLSNQGYVQQPWRGSSPGNANELLIKLHAGEIIKTFAQPGSGGNSDCHHLKVDRVRATKQQPFTATIPGLASTPKVAAKDFITDFYKGRLSGKSALADYFIDEPSGELLEQSDVVTSPRLGNALSDQVAGITTSYVYISSGVSVTQLHKEDLNLRSVNVLYGGYPKIWLVVSPKHTSKLETVLAHTFKLSAYRCDQCVRHVGVIVSPMFLDSYQIQYQLVIHEPGSFIMTDYGVYHQVYNTGPNLAEAVNGCTSDWNSPFMYLDCDSEKCPISFIPITTKQVRWQSVSVSDRDDAEGHAACSNAGEDMIMHDVNKAQTVTHDNRDGKVGRNDEEGGKTGNQEGRIVRGSAHTEDEEGADGGSDERNEQIRHVRTVRFNRRKSGARRSCMKAVTTGARPGDTNRGLREQVHEDVSIDQDAEVLIQPRKCREDETAFLKQVLHSKCQINAPPKTSNFLPPLSSRSVSDQEFATPAMFAEICRHRRSAAPPISAETLTPLQQLVAFLAQTGVREVRDGWQRRMALYMIYQTYVGRVEEVRGQLSEARRRKNRDRKPSSGCTGNNRLFTGSTAHARVTQRMVDEIALHFREEKRDAIEKFVKDAISLGTALAETFTPSPQDKSFSIMWLLLTEKGLNRLRRFKPERSIYRQRLWEQRPTLAKHWSTLCDGLKRMLFGNERLRIDDMMPAALETKELDHPELLTSLQVVNQSLPKK